MSVHPVEGDNGRSVPASVVDINEREQALRESEDKLALLLESTAEGIFGIDLEGRCTFCNPACLRMLGYQHSDQLIGKNMHDLVHHTRPDGTPHLAKDCPPLTALQGGEGVHVQDEVLWRADGTSFYAECWSNLQRKGQQVVGAVVAFIDISARKQIEEALKKSEEKFSKAFSKSPLALTLTSAKDHRYIDVNETFERQTGYSREEALGRTPFELGLWPNPSQRLEAVERLLAGGSVRNMEYSMRARDGRIGVYLGSAELIEIGGEQLVLAVIADITERRQAEQGLRQSEEKFRRVFEDAPAGMVMLSPEGRFRAVNRAFCEFLGYSEKELIGRDILFVTHPEDQAISWQAKEQALAGKVGAQRFEKRYLDKNGQLKWGELSTSLVRDSEGKPEYFVSQIVNITERKQAEEKLRVSEERLRLAQQAARIGTFEWDIRTRVVTWTPETEAMYGLPPGGFGGTEADFDNLVHPDDRAGIMELVEEGLKTGQLIQMEFRIIWPDGSVHWIAGRGQVFMNESGEPVRMVGVDIDVTERKQTEEALRASEERLRLAQWAARIGTFDWDIRTGVNTWTPETEAMYGLPPGGFGKTREAFQSLVHPDDRVRVVKLLEHALATGQPTEGEWRVVWPDGSVHWIAGRGQGFMNESGQPVRMVGVNIDVTERKLAEDRLREYERAIEGSEEMIAVVDREYRYVIANRKFLDQRRMTKEQVVGRLVPEILNKGIFETIVKEKLDECFQGKVVRYEMKYTYPELGERDVSISYFPIESPAGVDRVACILQDITERKRAELALRESEERLRLAAQVGRMYAYQWDVATGRVVRTPEGMNLLGLAGEPTQLTRQEVLDSVHPDDRARLMAAVADLTPENPYSQLRYRVLRPDGSVIWVEKNARAFFDDQGTLVRMIGMVADVTERKQAEDALSNVSRRLIEAQEQERTRIARELHDDINQKLAMLMIELDQLKRELSPGQLRSRMEELWNRTFGVSTDIQALSHRLHSSKLEYLGLVAAVQGFCAEFSEQHLVEVSFTHQKVPGALPEDISLCLFRILQAALANAVKHSGVERFEVRLCGTASGIHLTVHDAGIGFDLEQVLRGRGIGLISMRERARLVNGTISIQSKPNCGTTIDVDVPLSTPTADAQTARLATSVARVMVVEDFEPFRRMISSMLQNRAEVQVICEVADGLEAVQKAEELQPDLIVLDIGLPTLNGIEAARRIAKRVPQSKILFLSQDASADVVQQALSTGASGYAVKADAESELLTAVSAVLRGDMFVSSRLAGGNLHSIRSARA